MFAQAAQWSISAAPGAVAGYSSNASSLRWVFLGPPGVGKGTYASRIAAALNVPHIAAGDLVRAEIKSGSTLGQQMQAIVSKGQLLPDEIIIEVCGPHFGTGRVCRVVIVCVSRAAATCSSCADNKASAGL